MILVLSNKVNDKIFYTLLGLIFTEITIVGFFFIPVSSSKFFGHSIHSERMRNYVGDQAFQNDTVIISWLVSFRVIQPTVQWHTFKTFMLVFINFCSSQKLFVKYLINIDLIWLSVTRYKLKLSHGLTCHFMLDMLNWCAKTKESNKRAPGQVVIFI